MKIALIAHDKKKADMVAFVKEHLNVFKAHELYATGTTGSILIKYTGLKIHLKKSGPLGGDQEIGSMVANQLIDMIIFFRDPLTAQPHEPDVSALLRLSDHYEIPLATNRSTADLFINALEK
ncbi:methylglyoxal synthase [Tenericutes bacterium MZ-XQ]|jgi:methylglyoxal synthase|nr:methylglyoxal synthase [Tenericutes bacterium MZ-XQ]